MIGRNFIRRGKDSNINLPAEDDLNIGHGNENSLSAYCRLIIAIQLKFKHKERLYHLLQL